MTTVTTGVTLVGVMAGYRPSKNKPGTAWARYLDAVMQERDWSKSHLFKVIGPPLGYADSSRAAVLPLLHTKEPGPEQVAVLRSLFGDPPPEPPTPVIEPLPDPLALALDRQAGVMSDLVVELRQWRTKDQDRIDKLEATVALLAAKVLARRGKRDRGVLGAPLRRAE